VGEPEIQTGPVDLFAGERPRQDVEGWLASGAGLRSAARTQLVERSAMNGRAGID